MASVFHRSCAIHLSIGPALVVTVAVCVFSAYANLSFAVSDVRDYRFFPPFQPKVNANANDHLGAEQFNIACSLAAGEGFANPFGLKTGPTAWMAPVIPALLAGLLHVYGGSKLAVMITVIVLQDITLIATGFLMLMLATGCSQWLTAAIYLGALCCNFCQCFQFTHDSWLVMLCLDLLLCASCWWQPLRSCRIAAWWGAFGGFCALVTPVLGLPWVLISLATERQSRSWRPLLTGALVAGLMLAPWTIRNCLQFGRFTTVKSNLAYELYQSQCLTPDGILQEAAFARHPLMAPNGPEGHEYQANGEMAFLDRKRRQFLDAVRSNPLSFMERIGQRFLAATVLYIPFNRLGKNDDTLIATATLTHTLPFLSLTALLFALPWRRLDGIQSTVITLYCAYLLPYIAISYYARYAFPLLGMQTLLVTWATEMLLTLHRETSREKRSIVDSLRSGKANKAVTANSSVTLQPGDRSRLSTESQ